LLQFLLRGMMPERYGVHRHEVSAPQGTPSSRQGAATQEVCGLTCASLRYPWEKMKGTKLAVSETRRRRRDEVQKEVQAGSPAGFRQSG
jgi:hypothetical protein